MTQASESKDESNLLANLVAAKLISPAQADLVKSDHELTGMSPGEILLARRWVSSEKLFEMAPWLQDSTQASEVEAARTARGSDSQAAVDHKVAATGKAAGTDYQSNYEAYLEIVERVLSDK